MVSAMTNIDAKPAIRYVLEMDWDIAVNGNGIWNWMQSLRFG